MPKQFDVPNSTLTQLNEFSGGGYVLFIYDQNNCPKIYANLDSPAHGLGMQKFIQNWLAVVDTVNLESTIDELNGDDYDE